ncbi:MAG: IS4 family transposase [bacterium]
MMIEDWPILLSFFPDNWIEMASESNALKGLRKDKAAENYMRTLLIHIACGYSMRETAARAKLANLADISDVAMIGRLRKAKNWFHRMCVALFEEQGIVMHTKSDFQIRLFDATNVKEPGKTGSLWRIHYSLQLPSLCCDFFKLTATKGKGTGESFFQYSIKKGDYIIADRGYSTAAGIHHIVSKKAYVIVRVNTQSLPILNLKKGKFPLLENVGAIKRAGIVKSWKVLIPGHNNTIIQGRICVIRKSNEAIKLAHEKLKKNAIKKGHSIKPETLEYAKFIIVFTNYPEYSFSDIEVLELYRIRWQVELIFKRFKSIAQLGHLPKHSEESSKAWLYGKLFVALLTNRLIDYASSVSPWGYILEKYTTSECLA